MSIFIHYPAKNRIASYSAFQENEENENELQEDDEREKELEWSEEEYLNGSSDDDEFEDDFDDDDDDSDEFDDDFDSETEEDDHEYVDDEDSHYGNNYSTEPGYFYPEQPYIGLPIVPKPSPEASSSKLRYYILSPICDIAKIYIKFAILAILIYICALWYTVYYGELSDMDNGDDADTCPAN